MPPWRPRPPRALVPRTSIKGDRVFKRQAPAVARVEADKSRRARALGEQTGLFAVPALVEDRSEAGLLVFQRIDGLRPLQLALRGDEGDDWAALCDRTAAALRAVHGGLDPDPRLRRELSLRSPSAGVPTVALHGDCSPSNVMVQPSSGRLWIIDWAGADWLDPLLTHGPASVDLATFLLPLFWQRPGDPWRVPDPMARARRFLRAYADGLGEALDLSAVGAHCIELQDRLLPAARSRVSRTGALARWPLLAASRRFFRSLGAGV